MSNTWDKWPCPALWCWQRISNINRREKWKWIKKVELHIYIKILYREFLFFSVFFFLYVHLCPSPVSWSSMSAPCRKTWQRHKEQWLWRTWRRERWRWERWENRWQGSKVRQQRIFSLRGHNVVGKYDENIVLGHFYIIVIHQWDVKGMQRRNGNLWIALLENSITFCCIISCVLLFAPFTADKMDVFPFSDLLLCNKKSLLLPQRLCYYLIFQ